MRSATAIACTTFTLLVAAAPTDAVRPATAASRGCASAHSRLVLADAQARVFVPPENAHFETQIAYGCADRHGRSYQLGSVLECGSPSGCEGVAEKTLRLVGPIVAYEGFYVGGFSGGTEWEVTVRDLRTGRVLHEVPTGTPANPHPGYVGVGSITALVLKRDGAAAWIAEDNERSFGHAPYFDVEAVDHSGVRLLASGTGIAPGSLALKGSRVSWKTGRSRFSATLR
jgi:hypothetical protein